MKIFGELKGKTEHRCTIKSPIVSISDRLAIDLVHNDVPVTLFYKHGNYPWQSMLINNVFKVESVPRYSDIYLACSVNVNEKVVYDVQY